MATTMLLLKGLKEQGRLGRSFGKVTIQDQPPSNTIQKIIALKEAMTDMENFLQNINVSLLKMRTIVLSGQPKVRCYIVFEYKNLFKQSVCLITLAATIYKRLPWEVAF